MLLILFIQVDSICRYLYAGVVGISTDSDGERLDEICPITTSYLSVGLDLVLVVLSVVVLPRDKRLLCVRGDRQSGDDLIYQFVGVVICDGLGWELVMR